MAIQNICVDKLFPMQMSCFPFQHVNTKNPYRFARLSRSVQIGRGEFGSFGHRVRFRIEMQCNEIRCGSFSIFVGGIICASLRRMSFQIATKSVHSHGVWLQQMHSTSDWRSIRFVQLSTSENLLISEGICKRLHYLPHRMQKNANRKNGA